MKKYNLSNIMKRAWELVKKNGYKISEGLRKSWAEAKNMKKKFEGYLKMVAVGSENCADWDESKYVKVKLWEKHGKKRIYFNEYKGRTVGYIDLIENKTVNYDGFAKMYIPTIEKFKSEYEF